MPENEHCTWSEPALPIAKLLLERDLGLQAMHDVAAERLGLVHGDRLEDLPSEQMSVDTALHRPLDETRLDVRATAAAISALKTASAIHESVAWLRDRAIDRQLRAVRDGSGPPVLTTWAAVGKACFTGAALEVRDHIPGMIASAAKGRRLGDLATTGRSDLNDRPVLSVQTAGRLPIWSHGLPDLAGAALRIKPDLMTVGARR